MAKLNIERVLAAPRADVYRALTEPEQLARWWGPAGFGAPSIEFEPRVGGDYRIAMQPPDGELFHLVGEFREVQPPVRVAYTFRWLPPDPDDRETLATLSLEERDRQTRLLVTQAGFATDERRALHERGWSDSLERLARLLGGQA
jgi:uncharacterized protein YndB with AHSA1/START domain